ERLVPPLLLGGQGEDRLEEPGFPDRELGRVDPDGEPARAGGEVVARERALAPLVQLPLRGQRERVGRDDDPLPEQGALGGVHQNFPSRVSKWLGLFSVRPPVRTQWATQEIIGSTGTAGGPKTARARDASLRSAVSASRPVSAGFLPRSSPKRRASSRTLSVSAPVTLKIRGGDPPWNSIRRAIALASPCQITLTWPIVTSRGVPVHTFRAISSRMP